jgi:LSU ribosomal protein L35P
MKGKGVQVPKMKSHTGIGKRTRVTGSGKIVKEKAGKRHKLEHKSSRRTRRLTGTEEISRADVRRVKKLLGR